MTYFTSRYRTFKPANNMLIPKETAIKQRTATGQRASVQPGWTLALWPVAVLCLIAVSLGISMLLAGLNVRYRDVKYVIPFVIQLGLFITPVIYPASFLPARVRPILALNPLSGIVELFRVALFPHRRLDLQLVMISVATTLVLFVGGAAYFRKSEQTFADII